jgi:acyl-CoA thioester hydrolase
MRAAADIGDRFGAELVHRCFQENAKIDSPWVRRAGRVRYPPRMEYESARTVVYPWNCDSMGHFATQHCMKVFDDATYHLLGALGYSLRDAHLVGRGWADVSHKINYLSELRAGDLLVAYSSVQRVGNKSLTYRTRLVRAELPQDDCAILTGVVVYFDLERRCALVLPDAIRAAALKAMGERAP